MAALHQHSSFRPPGHGRWLPWCFHCRGIGNTPLSIEITRLFVGRIIKMRIIISLHFSIQSTFMGTELFFLFRWKEERCYQLPPPFCQLTAWNEIVEVGRNELHIITNIRSSAQFCQLANNILALWFLCQLVLSRKEDAVEIETSIDSLQGHRQWNLALCGLSCHLPLKLHIVVPIKRHSGFQACRHFIRVDQNHC